MRLAVANTRESSAGSALDHLLIITGPDGFLDAALGFFLLPRDAFGVDPQQDIHAMACPFGDLGRGYSGVKPLSASFSSRV